MKKFLKIGCLALSVALMAAMLTGCGIFHKIYFYVDGEQYCYIWGRQGATMKDVDTPTQEGYTFSGWFEDEALTIPYEWPEKMPEEDGSLYGSLIPNDQVKEDTGTKVFQDEQPEQAPETVTEPTEQTPEEPVEEPAEEPPEEKKPSILDIENGLQ
ncbi:MAG: InlB B-repeat-containing protein [Oscillospiraceae bacterium]|nr:InlB B-repeat-containing protein [Oscillospiraceae bacterium]